MLINSEKIMSYNSVKCVIHCATIFISAPVKIAIACLPVHKDANLGGGVGDPRNPNGQSHTMLKLFFKSCQKVVLNIIKSWSLKRRLEMPKSSSFLVMIYIRGVFLNIGALLVE